MEPFDTQSAVLKPFQLYGGAYNFWGLAESQHIPPHSLQCWDGSSVPDLVPSNDMISSESMVDIKPGGSGVLIGYHTRLMSLLTPSL